MTPARSPEDTFDRFPLPRERWGSAGIDFGTTSNARQQDKLIKFLATNEARHLYERSVELTDDERERVLEKLAFDQIAPEKLRELLLAIETPIEKTGNPKNPTELFEKIEMSKQIRGLIARGVYGDPRRRDALTAADLGALYEKYQDPASLEDTMLPFLFEIETYNGPAKRKEYEDCLRALLATVYGKRHNYWEQMKLLRRDAESRFGKERLETYHIDEIDQKEATALMDRVEIHGDDLFGKKLTPELLKERGLEPHYRVEIGKTVLWFSSRPYELAKKRIAVMAYIESEGKLVARSYYRSNTHGIWKYLPNYLSREGERIQWYGKGHSEESISLPIALQRALARLGEREAPLKIPEPEFIFAGTARDAGRAQAAEATFFREVESRPRELDGNFYLDFNERRRGRKVAPEELTFRNPEQAPNFGRMLAGWLQETNLYGTISVEAFPSKDGTLRYLFCRDHQGRAWIGAIEDVTSELQSTGLRAEWVRGGDLLTTVYAHDEEDGGYGKADPALGSYRDMWPNYLSKVPVIQEYLRARSTYEESEL